MQVGRNDIAQAVVVLRVVGQQHAQPVANGDTGRDDEEGVGEARVLRIGAFVERVPSDEHGHDHGLAGARGHLERCPRQAGIRGVVRLSNRVLDPGIAVLPGDLGDIDGGFESFILAEEKLFLAGGIGPVGNQARGGGRYADVAALAPHADAPTDVVDELVLLDAVLGPLGVKLKLLAFLLRPGDGDEIGAGPAAVNDLVGDALVGKAKMAGRFVERRVEDWILDDDLVHTGPGPLYARCSRSGILIPTCEGGGFWRRTLRAHDGTMNIPASPNG